MILAESLSDFVPTQHDQMASCARTTQDTCACYHNLIGNCPKTGNAGTAHNIPRNQGAFENRGVLILIRIGVLAFL
jgi:hypothetical protein